MSAMGAYTMGYAGFTAGRAGRTLNAFVTIGGFALPTLLLGYFVLLNSHDQINSSSVFFAVPAIRQVQLVKDIPGAETFGGWTASTIPHVQILTAFGA